MPFEHKWAQAYALTAWVTAVIAFLASKDCAILAAGSVLFSHAFLIATGTENEEPLRRLLGPGNILGLYGVYTFFIISGFLLAHSLARDPSILRFSINRILRIYPGFLFCILLTAVLLGPMGSTLDWSAYISRSEVASYVTSAFWCVCDPESLPGVYAYEGVDNVSRINGSLWSLSFEVLSYVMLVWFWLALRKIEAVAAAFILLSVGTAVEPAVYQTFQGVAYTLPYFAGGVVMCVVYQRIGLSARVAAGCAVLLLASAVFGLQRQAYAVVGAYLVVFLGNRANVGSSLASHVGDLSYGTYLFGWPIERLVKQYVSTESPWLLMAIAGPLVLAIAAVSFHFVERPALTLKRSIANFVDATLIIPDQEERRTITVAATLTFLIAALVMLLVDTHWWLATRGLAEVIMWSATGAIMARAILRVVRLWTRRSSG